MNGNQISVCICTYQRPKWLARLLLALSNQKTDGLFSYSIVVADNDAHESARATVEEYAATSPVRVDYCVEPAKNIALVRNKAIGVSRGNWIAFIDDDEFPVETWLWSLLRATEIHRAQGALGPVRPHFEETPPPWVKKCGLYDRPEHETGYLVPWRESRTGNVLFRSDILTRGTAPFDERFPNGGEDQDFFRRMMESGARFIWCNEAVVYETVPPIRWNKKVMMQRALLRGRNTLKHAEGNNRGVLKSLIAVVIYSLALPFLAVAGEHLYIRYLIKTCDHLGKVLAALKLNWVSERVG